MLSVTDLNNKSPFPRMVQAFDLFNNGADIALNTLQFIPQATACYIVYVYLVITTRDPVSSTLPQAHLTYVDGDTGSGPSATLSNADANNSVGTSNWLDLNNQYGFMINAKSGGIISPFTNGYGSNTPGLMKFALHSRIVLLG